MYMRLSIRQEVVTNVTISPAAYVNRYCIYELFWCKMEYQLFILRTFVPKRIEIGQLLLCADIVLTRI